MINKEDLHAVLLLKKRIEKFGRIKNVNYKQMIKLNTDEEIDKIRKLPEFCYFVEPKRRKWYDADFREIKLFD